MVAGKTLLPIKHNHTVSGTATFDSSLSGNLSIIALRNAIAVQKYKEIQLANDVDFQSQIEAHFGIKPNDKDENSLFIGGSSSMININEQINQNLTPGNKAFYGAAPHKSSALGAGIISGAGSLIGGLFSSGGSHYAARKQLQAVRETNQTNLQIAQQNNAFNERMWNMQNEYNTPQMQRARLEAAGLNPYLS